MTQKTLARAAAGIVGAVGAAAGGVFAKRKMDEEAFRRALVRGIRDVGGSGIAHDPYEAEQECLAKST